MSSKQINACMDASDHVLTKPFKGARWLQMTWQA